MEDDNKPFYKRYSHAIPGYGSFFSIHLNDAIKSKQINYEQVKCFYKHLYDYKIVSQRLILSENMTTFEFDSKDGDEVQTFLDSFGFVNKS